MSSDEEARAALQRLFPKPFTDYQWSALVSQGYEEAVRTGARSAEEVAAELKALMAAATEGQKAAKTAKTAKTAAADSPPFGWDQMEKLVLGRILVSDARSGPESDTSGCESRTSRRKERLRRIYRYWSALGAFFLLAAAVVVLALINPWDESRGALDSAGVSASSTSTDASQASSVPAGTPSSTTLPASTTSTTSLVEVLWPYTARLSGANAVPSVKTEAGGTLTLTVAAGGTSVHYLLTVSSLKDFLNARLRLGKTGLTGEEIMTIREGVPIKGLFSGLVVEGDFTADDLIGPLVGKTIDDLVALIKAGEVYLNVSTKSHWRTGEIRGQVE
jgi:hypothetical protein